MVKSSDNTRGESSDYEGILKITQYSGKNVQLASYYIHNAKPVNVASIELDHDSNDAVEEFSVTIAYDYHTGDLEGTGAGASSAL